MGHKSLNLDEEVNSVLKRKLALGRSKHADKRILRPDGRPKSTSRIYSYSTLYTYQRHCRYFVAYCRKKHKCKSLEECRRYAGEWLRRSESLSAWTVHMEASALGKLYDCPSTAFCELPERRRSDIRRSRKECVRDKGFSESKNSGLVAFCRATGLRRHELEVLRGSQLEEIDGRFFLRIRGKGGRLRIAPIIGAAETVNAVVAKMQAAGDGLVWGKVNSHADIHSYRADYAKAIYTTYARPLDELLKAESYYCRRDRAGVKYDRQALMRASEALGHSRVSLVAYNYLYQENQPD